MANEKVFLEGCNVKEGGVPNMPWLIAKFGFNKKFIEFLNANMDEKGWMNADLMKSKNGTLYMQLNNWKGQAKVASAPAASIEYPEEETDINSIPF